MHQFMGGNNCQPQLFAYFLTNQALDFVLRQRIAENMQLPNFARAGRYLLRYFPTYEKVPRGSLFTQAFRPGARLIMPLLLSYDDKNVDICPACHAPNDTTGSSTSQCGVCGLVYTRSKQSYTHIIMEPAHRGPITEPSEAKSTADEETVNQRTPIVPNALERPQKLPTNDVPRFKIVQNVKHVDVSSPRMMLLFDLLGYIYIVPWHMVETAEQMAFFLRFFTAGGLKLVWSLDYVVLDDRNIELTPANWEAGAYPGISITMRLKNQDGLIALRNTLISKIQGVLSTLAPTFQGKRLEDLVEEVCLLVGASKAQIEMKCLVRKTVVAHLDNYRKCHYSSSSVVVQDRSISSPSCLICHEACATSLDLAKHARCHIMALRCAGVCNVCDTEESPSLAKDDVSQRHRQGLSEPRVEQPSVSPKKDFGIRLNQDSPRGSWSCCRCRQTNARGLCPDRCPADGHYKCGRCYISP